jgi:hypothetical protein
MGPGSNTWTHRLAGSPRSLGLRGWSAGTASRGLRARTGASSAAAAPSLSFSRCRAHELSRLGSGESFTTPLFDVCRKSILPDQGLRNSTHGVIIAAVPASGHGFSVSTALYVGALVAYPWCPHCLATNSRLAAFFRSRFRSAAHAYEPKRDAPGRQVGLTEETLASPAFFTVSGSMEFAEEVGRPPEEIGPPQAPLSGSRSPRIASERHVHKPPVSWLVVC